MSTDLYLRWAAWRGLEKRVPDYDDKYRARLKYELDTIIALQFADYFLVLAYILHAAREEGIRIGPGRGSAGGSLVAYALGITDLDPLLFGLMFERFLNPDRVSLPDIDVDVAEDQRARVLEIAREKYGADCVAQIATFGTIGAKAALKDAARVLGHPYKVGEERAQALPPAKFGRAPSLEAYTGPRDEIYDLACGLEGTIRNESIHPAAVVIAPEPLKDQVPIRYAAGKGDAILALDMHEVEDLGYVKQDFLGLRTLKVIDDCLRMLSELPGHGGLPTSPVDCDDPQTYSLLSRGDTTGVFQLDGSGMRGLLRIIEPTTFDDVSAALALYRPGPLGVGAHTDFAHRKNGRQQVDYIHPELREALTPILGETHGLIVFQEQVMAIAQAVAGYSLGQADLLRRAMGKKKPEVLAAEYESFAKGMRDRGYSDGAVNALWETLVPFADYAFNRCVTGDTTIERLGTNRRRWSSTVEAIANRLHGRVDYNGTGCRYCHDATPVGSKATQCWPCKSWRAKWNLLNGMNAAGRVGDRILPIKVVDVFRQGVKPVWRMTLSNGLSVTCTANHRHLTPRGWREMGELAVGDAVCVMGVQRSGQTPRTDTPYGPGWAGVRHYVDVRSHGKAGPFLHGRAAQFSRNRALLRRECYHCGSRTLKLEVAHLDSDALDNEIENLAHLCTSCHRKHDYATGSRKKRWAKGREIEESPIVSIEYVGEEMTYDVAVDSEDHSWVANGGVITHNSHTAGYGLISYWTAYLKANHPHEWMAALLSNENDNDKLHEYLSECRRMGVAILPPDINESGGTFTPTEEGIRYGMAAIRGVGDKAVSAVMGARPYKTFADYLTRVPQAGLNVGVVTALARCGALDSLTGGQREGLLEVVERHCERAVSVRKASKAAQRGIATPTYRVPKRSVDNAQRRRWERETLGVELSTGRILVRPRQPLNQPEMEWIRRTLVAHPGHQPVYLDLEYLTVPTGCSVQMGRVVEALANLGKVDIREE
jgi:hypothetical protein